MSTPPSIDARASADTPVTGADVGALSREAIARVDPSGQLEDVLALPEHLRDALWRVESAIMQGWDTAAGLVVAGMGGSAIGGALARGAGRPRVAADLRDSRVRAAAVDDTGHDGAVRELLGRH